MVVLHSCSADKNSWVIVDMILVVVDNKVLVVVFEVNDNKVGYSEYQYEYVGFLH